MNLNKCRGGERVTASLRRRMVLIIKRAAQGKLELPTNTVQVLVLQLVTKTPGLVVRSVVNSHQTRSALQGDPTLAAHELAGNVRRRSRKIISAVEPVETALAAPPVAMLRWLLWFSTLLLRPPDHCSTSVCGRTHWSRARRRLCRFGTSLRETGANTGGRVSQKKKSS